MYYRIKSELEFKEKMQIALKLQTLIKSKKANKQNEDVFLVLMSELKEYSLKLKK
jgi:hypothetical protein